MMKSRLTSLPLECLMQIISHTTPSDASRVSLVSTELRSVADSDPVWETFLPEDYHSFVPPNFPFRSIKELYMRLSDHPILTDGGLKSFWLDKETGKKCYMLGGRDLTITWSGFPMYWTWNSLSQSRFKEVANLRIVWWLDIKGKISTSMLSPRTNYAIYLVFQTNDKFYGFEGNPLESSIGVVGGKTATQLIYLYPRHDATSCPARRDGWYEVELGDFFNEGGEDEELGMRIMEVKTKNAKYGLVVEGIEMRPKFGRP